MDDRLIFLVSAPRSGSSLLQRIIAESNDVYSDVESFVMFLAFPVNQNPGLSDTVRQATRHLIEKGAGCPELLDSLGSDLPDSIYRAVLERQEKKYFLDKTPAYTRIITRIHQAYPGARYIILLRHPMALLYSSLTTWTNGDYSRLYWCNYDLIGALQDIAEFIRLNVESPEIRKIYYEELVGDPTRIVNQLNEFLGLEIDTHNVVYSVDSTQRNITANTYFGDPKSLHEYDRPQADFADKWIRLAHDAQTLRFALSYMEILGDTLIRQLGYDSNQITSTLLSEAESQGISVSRRRTSLQFETVITPPDQRNRRQRHEINRYRYREKYGVFGPCVYFLNRLKNKLAYAR